MKMLGRASALALFVGVCAWWAIRYTQGMAGLSTLWPGSGILCGVLLTSPRERWLWYFAAGLCAFVLVNLPLHGLAVSTASLSLANFIDAAVVAFVVARGVGDVTDLSRIRRSTAFAAIGTVAACALSAGIAAATLAPHMAVSFGGLYLAWFASHALGMAIFATLTVVARAQGWRIFGARGRRIELLAELTLLAGGCWLVFGSGSFALPFLLFPPLLLIVFRHRLAGFVLGVALVAVVAVSVHAFGRGPFQQLSAHSELERALALQVFIASVCILTLPVAVVLTGRDELTRRLARSEREYRILADYSSDLIIRFDADGVRRYISPSVTEMLGWTIEDLERPRLDIVHPEDLGRFRKALAELRASGGSTTVQYRVRHKDGHYVTLEAHARLVPGPRPGGEPDIIYSARDVSQRIAAQKALQANQRRLRAITDNLPAIVLHIDKDERYTFANAHTARAMGIDAAQLIGRRVREAMGDAVYGEIEPYMKAALRGETVSFEIERDFLGKPYYYQSTYVPDLGEDGAINGFYAVSFDITELKRAQSDLLRLARYDALTGAANRLHFIERLELAIARSHRNRRPVALLYLDLDYFKQINDTLGHAAGDEVLREFARRLQRHVRDVDLVARLGGDEFVVVLEEIDSPEAVQALAAKLIDCLEEPIPIEGTSPVVIGASVGIVFSRHPVDDAETLLQKADKALYEAKRAGRNVWRMAG